METWKPVVTFEGVYEISSLGNLRRILPVRYGGKKVPYTLKKRWSTDGYIQYSLHHENRKMQVTAHRLVAAAFLGYTQPHLQVNHLNGIRDDNRVENLEWVTIKQNLAHSYEKLNRVRWRKLTDEQVSEIKYRRSLGVPRRRLARDFGVVPETIMQIDRNRIACYRDIPLAKYVRV